MTNEQATTITVAQAISFAVDEFPGLLLDRDEDSDSDLRVTEVAAELYTHQMPSGPQSEFIIKTSDGRSFTVRVTENYA